MWEGLTSKLSRRRRRPGSAFAPAEAPVTLGGEPVGARADWPQPLPGSGGRWSICHNRTGLGQPGLFELYGFSRHSESQPPLRRYKPDTMPKIIKNIGKTVSYFLWPPAVHVSKTRVTYSEPDSFLSFC